LGDSRKMRRSTTAALSERGYNRNPGQVLENAQNGKR
jgi:hypothetical protein